MLDERRDGDLSAPGRSSPIVLQHLRYAVSAAEHGSFRRAAETLLLRQSTLSRCVRQLEESVGLIVFERFSGGVRCLHSPDISVSTIRARRHGDRPSVACQYFLEREAEGAVTNGSALLPGVDGRSAWIRRCKDLIAES